MIHSYPHENDVASAIVQAAFRIHVTLGPGLLESVYEAALAHEMEMAGIHFLRQASFAAHYGDVILKDVGFRVDFLVESRVIVEIKSVEKLSPVHFKTILTYLKQSDRKLGLLINFNCALIKDGLHRVVNGL